MEKKWAIGLVIFVVVGALYFLVNSKPLPGPSKTGVSPTADSTYATRLESSSRFIEIDKTSESDLPGKPSDHFHNMLDSMALADSGKRIDSIKDEFTKWCADDPEASTRWAAENTDLRLDSDTQADLIREGLTIWAYKGKPLQSANYAASLKLENQIGNPIEMVTSVWARTDYLATKSYVDQIGDKEIQIAAVRGLISEVARNDPQKAAQLAQSYGTESDIASHRGIVAGEWAKKDLNAASSWVNSLPEGQRTIPMMAITSTVLDKNPEATAQWAAGLPATSSRSDAISMVAVGLTIKDAGAGADWITSLPAGTDRELAATNFAENNRETHPALSANMAALISDPAKRQEQLSAILKPWMAQQPAQAQKWLQANPTAQAP